MSITTTAHALQEAFLQLDPDKGPEKGKQIEQIFQGDPHTTEECH